MKCSSPHQSPQSLGPAPEGLALKMFGFETDGSMSGDAKETKTLLLKGSHTDSLTLGSSVKQGG